MKVLLVDEEPLVLAAIRAVIRQVGDDVLLVAVTDASEVAGTLRTERGFDLCLLHVEPEVPGGCDALIGLRRDHPELPIVALSSTERPSEVVRMVEFGAMGCVPRRLEGDQMLSALAMVFSGGVFIPPVVLGLLRGSPLAEGDTVPSVMRPAAGETRPGDIVSAAAEPVPAALATAGRPAGGARDSEAPGPHPAAAAGGGAGPGPALQGLGLTPRQCDVLALLLKGLPNKLIARELNLSVDTVKDHVAAVLRALNVNSRTQAVLRVSQMTLTAPGAGWHLPATR
jgi:DNA-binding NarL/FixJ family response regulator